MRTPFKPTPSVVVCLEGQRQWNARLWAGTGAPTQALFGTHAVGALLTGQEGSPEQAAGPLEWWVGRASRCDCEPGHFDRDGLPRAAPRTRLGARGGGVHGL
eukprot:scaffold106199_cov27-Phaeocystis_antarctica.AAC.2